MHGGFGSPGADLHRPPGVLMYKIKKRPIKAGLMSTPAGIRTPNLLICSNTGFGCYIII